MNEINSETHSWIVSFASLDIFGPSKLFSRLSFIIRPIFAIGRKLDIKDLTDPTLHFLHFENSENPFIINLRIRDHVHCWRFILSAVVLLLHWWLKVRWEPSCSYKFILRLTCLRSFIVLDFVSGIVDLIWSYISIVWNLTTAKLRTTAWKSWSCPKEIVGRQMSARSSHTNTIRFFKFFSRVRHECCMIMWISSKW